MEHVHSILLIKKDDKFLTYYDNRWEINMFPNIKGNKIEDIKKKMKYDFNVDNCNVKFLFDKVHEKYSYPNKEMRTYHHYFYEVELDADINDGLYTSLEHLLLDDKVVLRNSDIIHYVKEYYNK